MGAARQGIKMLTNGTYNSGRWGIKAGFMAAEDRDEDSEDEAVGWDEETCEMANSDSVCSGYIRFSFLFRSSCALGRLSDEYRLSV